MRRSFTAVVALLLSLGLLSLGLLGAYAATSRYEGPIRAAVERLNLLQRDPPPAPAMTLYQNEQYPFSIQYPADFRELPSDEYPFEPTSEGIEVLFTNEGRAFLDISSAVIDLPAEPGIEPMELQATDVANSLLTWWILGVVPELAELTTEPRLADAGWCQEVFSFTGGRAAYFPAAKVDNPKWRYHYLGMASVHEGADGTGIFTILYAVPEDQWESMAPDIEASLRSFQVTDGSPRVPCKPTLAKGIPLAEGAGASYDPALSSDGRYIAFASDAENLVPNDTNYTMDVFVHDRESGQTERVSVASDGSEGTDSSGTPVAISADGRYVAFDSYASNLVPGDTNESGDIFVHDRETGQTERVSVASDGSQAIPGQFQLTSSLSLSADGRYVLFASGAVNLVPDDTNDVDDLFLHDRQSGETTRVSVSSSGGQATGNNMGFVDTLSGAISADGRYIAFFSDALGLAPEDTNDVGDVFVHDRQTGETTLISIDQVTGEAAGYAYNVAISADGRYVAFDSAGDNLVPNAPNRFSETFVHDLHTGETTRITGAPLEGQVNDTFASDTLAISGDGRYVAYVTEGRALPAGDLDEVNALFIHDRQTGETTRLSVPTNAAQAATDVPGYAVTMSADGRYVAFESQASYLVPHDTNEMSDVFVYDRETGEITCFPPATDMVP